MGGQKRALGYLIAKKRKEHGLTQDQFAEEMNVARQTVSSWENDNFIPDTLKVIQMARFLGCTTDDLLNPTTPRQPGAESAAAEPVVAEG